MSHPGPPRFVATGDEVELAPRDPTPAGSYSWTLRQTPEASEVVLGDDPVEHLEPDVPGTYVARLAAPDGDHDLTIRVLPSDHTGGRGHVSGTSAGVQKGVTGRDWTEQGGSYAPAPTAGNRGGGGRPRLTLEPAVEDDEAVVRADPRPHPGGTESASDLSVEFLVDDRDDLGRDAMRTRGHELRVPLAALSGRTRIYAVAIGAAGFSVPDAVEFMRSGGSNRDEDDTTVTAARPYDPPAWAENAVVYEIYVRTFAGPGANSTFDAISDRLDYIASLGVDALWLTPVLENDHAPHGYNITDFFSIASDLGSRTDYRRFVEAAHDRDIKVLFDLVCNHSARTHPYFQQALADPDSEYREWYAWRTDTDPETYFDWEHIANFNFEHLPVRRHLLDVVDEWAPLVDGFRCDMAWAVPNSFWREIHDRCKAHDPEFLLLDETIPYIPDFQAGLFDMHFDSTTYFTLRQVGNGEDADALLDAIDSRAEAGFPDHAAFMLYAENHDETRYIVECGRPAARAAAGAVFTLPGAPMVYAGQEFGQRGQRDGLAWEHADDDMRAFVAALAAVRHDHPALAADAALLRVPYDVHVGTSDRVVAYARRTDGEAVVVVLNFGAQTATVTVPAAADSTDSLTDTDCGVTDAPTATTVTVEDAVVLPAGSGLAGD